MRRYILVGLILSLTFPARADVVTFQNGDQLQGRIVTLQSGRLRFNSVLFGLLSAPLSEVETFASDDEIELSLADGETLNARVERSEPGSIVIRTPDGIAREPLEFDQVKWINRPAPEKQERFSGNLEIAMDIDRGNAHQHEADFAFSLERPFGRHTVRLWGDYEGDRNRTDGDRTTTKVKYRLGLRHSFDLTDRYYLVQKVRVRKEATADLDRRLTSSSGLGIRWRNTERATFTTETGLAWIHEDFSDDTDTNNYLAGRVEWMLNRQLNPYVSLLHNGEWIPSLRDFGEEHLIETETGIKTKLTEKLYVKSTIEWDWDSDPADDSKQQDVNYVLTLGYEF
jgi:putative salt-induced outer membrane protein YdiY